MRVIWAVLVGAVAVAVWLVWPSAQWVPAPIAGLAMECFNETEPVAHDFCINRVAGSRNRDVVYHFHGRNGAATWWNDSTYYTGEIEAYWRNEGVDAPTVISVSFGPVWLLVSELERTFVDVVMPNIEKRLSAPVARRMVVGESMGAVNALLVGLKSKAHFARVAALCPVLPTVSPRASISEIAAYVGRTSTTWRRALTLLALSRRFYPTHEFWLENHPTPVAQRYDPTGGPAFYVSCGRTDEWGCLEGSEALVSALGAKHGVVEWHPTPGGHCDIDVTSLAEFLTRPSPT